MTSPTAGTVGSSTSRFRAARAAIAAATAAAVAVMAAGCMVGPNYKVPPTPAPADYGESHPGPTTKASQPVDLAVWWRTFNDPELNSLISRAIAGNNTFLQAQARVRQARAQLGVEWGNEFPTLDLDGGYTRTQTSRSSPGVSTGTSSGNKTTGSGTTSWHGQHRHRHDRDRLHRDDRHGHDDHDRRHRARPPAARPAAAARP